MSKQHILKWLERGRQAIFTDRFLREHIAVQRNMPLRGWDVSILGGALGETLDKVKYPVHWERLLKRKDCPQYMKELGTLCVNVYYPKVSLPEEEHWLTIDRKNEV